MPAGAMPAGAVPVPRSAGSCDAPLTAEHSAGTKAGPSEQL